MCVDFHGSGHVKILMPWKFKPSVHRYMLACLITALLSDCMDNLRYIHGILESPLAVMLFYTPHNTYI